MVVRPRFRGFVPVSMVRGVGSSLGPSLTSELADARLRLFLLMICEACFSLDHCGARLYTAILRHAVLVMAALATRTVATVLLRG